MILTELVPTNILKPSSLTDTQSTDPSCSVIMYVCMYALCVHVRLCMLLLSLCSIATFIREKVLCMSTSSYQLPHMKNEDPHSDKAGVKNACSAG